jgi:D-glycero-alpha-D-manno-heptose 1-phosphate guanylyltransferase
VVPDLPKPLAPVAGRPFLTYLLDEFARGGMRRAILATGYMAEKIEQLIGDRWQGMEVIYSRETEPLGTGGAIRQAVQLLAGDAAYVTNGDTFARIDLGELEKFTRARQLPMGMALAWVPDSARYGAVDIEADRVAGFQEKGSIGGGYINAGTYLLTSSAIAALPSANNYSFESEVLRPQVLAGRVAAFGKSRDFIDIGVPDDYRRAQDLLAR